eukprot:scaffold4849_cov153-Amphora_coffeaeformis.AAC.1
MLRMLIVKSSKCNNDAIEESELNHRTKIIKYLVVPWARTHRVVVADSYFASVMTAKELYKMGLRFIGVVKTATKDTPWDYCLQVSSVVEDSGNLSSTLVTRTQVTLILAFAWVDRNRRYFISSVSNLWEVAPIERHRMRQVDLAPNAEPERVYLSIRQPNASKLYYDNCGRIDQHNRVRQADLKIEHKYGTNDWSLRVNLSLFSVCVVDSYHLYTNATGDKESPHAFFSALAEELIDYGRVTRAQLQAIGDASPTLKRTASSVAASVGPYITPMKKKRSPGKEGKCFSEQKRYSECSKKTTWVCSECYNMGIKAAICHTRV